MTKDELNEKFSSIYKDYSDSITRFFNESNSNREAIQRVRELHVSKEYENTCKTCDKTDMGATIMYPCPTIKALDGEQDV